MLTLQYPKPSTAVYPKTRFGLLGNLYHRTAFNRKAFLSFTADQAYNQENEHILVGLLHQLSINADWDLDYVVSYTRFRAYSLCTLFKITSLGRTGAAQANGFYRENVREHWCLIENERRYDKTVALENLSPVIPLTSTVTKHMYTHTLGRSEETFSHINDLAIMGVDLVELAVGYWLYQQSVPEREAGPHGYVAKVVLTKAQLFHNQLSVLNIVYEHLLHAVPVADLLKTDPVRFATLDEGSILSAYIDHLVTALTSRRLANLEQMIQVFDSIYPTPYFNYVRAGKNASFSQTAWCWEPALMKLYNLYFELANRNGHVVGDLASQVIRSHNKRISNYTRAEETYFRGWLFGMADELLEKVQINLKLG